MLYRPELFEPLTGEPWCEQRVRSAIQAIVADAEAAYNPDRLWPAHPDEWHGFQAAPPLKNLYVGAAGVIWALDALDRRGYTTPGLDLGRAALRALELWRAAPGFLPEFPFPAVPASSLLCGETGLLLVAWRLCPRADLADALLARVADNLASDSDELMWGVAGTLLAAVAMHRWTGEDRWADAVALSAEALRARRGADGLWKQREGRFIDRFIGPMHGMVGIVGVLCQIEDRRNAALARETADVLAHTAIMENGCANWPMLVDGPPELESRRLLQWCNGAPGVITSAARYLDHDLLLAGAATVWSAGPQCLEKGAGICHGTAGNGYALLATFARTGDELWLERARRFAVHALGQVERLRSERGAGRYSLWTGDVGAALFAADAIDAVVRYPLLDSGADPR